MNLRCLADPMRLWTGPVLLWFSVSGCATWAPTSRTSASTPVLPAIEVPSSWLAADVARAGGQGVGGSSEDSLAAWWRRFNDPLMAELVSRALASNTSINSAHSALRQALALRGVAAAALLPTLGASAFAQLGRAGGNSTGSSLQAGLDAQWVPDVFGARRSGLDVADAVAAASAASLGDTQVQVAAEVALNYILLRSLQARWAIANDNLASQQETRQITDWRQQAGLVTALGGVVGVLIATVASYGGAVLMAVPYEFDPAINAVALVFSAAIGMLFGYFPARRAAQMDPIEALRHE